MRTHTGWGRSELVHKALCSLCDSHSGDESSHSFSYRGCPLCVPACLRPSGIVSKWSAPLLSCFVPALVEGK